MDSLANQTAYGSAEWKWQRSGARMGLVGLGLLLLAFPLWKAHDFIPTLAMKRAMAIASVSILHSGTEVQLQRAFAAANTSSPAEASLERERNPALHGRPTYYVSVTADTPAHARAGLAAFTDALRAAFPSSEENLVLTQSNSTVPVPNELSRRIWFGTQAAVVLMMLGGQFLVVIGARREGLQRAALVAAIATPFVILIGSLFFPSESEDVIGDFQYAVSQGDWKFLVLFALTPVSVMLGLLVSRRSRPAAGQYRRAARAAK